MQNPFLIGSRVYFRPLERSDAATVQPWFNDIDRRRYTLITRPVTLTGEEEFIDRVNRDEQSILMLLATIDGNRPIGVAGYHHIDPVHRKAEFGISLEKGSWGQGYGSEATRLMVDYAFITLNLHRVYLRVFEFNERAIRCYLKAGFQKEGVLRQEHYTEGRYWDALIMSVLRPEWETRRKSD